MVPHWHSVLALQTTSEERLEHFFKLSYVKPWIFGLHISEVVSLILEIIEISAHAHGVTQLISDLKA